MKKTLLIALFVLMTALTVPAQETADCSELFFSEYVEGSGNNKALEIYNPTDQVIDLSYYFVARFSNGSSTFTSGGYTQLEGFLPGHSVFILVNGQTEDVELGGGSISPKCDPALQELASNYPYQMDHGYPAPTYMNGNDAIVLMKSEDKDINDPNIQIIDIIGQVGLGNKIEKEYGWSNIRDTTVTYNARVINGEDTTYVETKGKVIDWIVQHTDTSGQFFGPFWLAWTKDHTLVRKPSVTKGVTVNPDGFDVAAQWDTVPGGKDQWDSLGTHTCNCAVSSVQDPGNTFSQVYIYPNPVTYHTFEIISDRPIEKVVVTNLLGQEVFLSDPAEGVNHSYRVTLPAQAPPGIYLVRVNLKNGNSTVRKILVK